ASRLSACGCVPIAICETAQIGASHKAAACPQAAASSTDATRRIRIAHGSASKSTSKSAHISGVHCPLGVPDCVRIRECPTATISDQSACYAASQDLSRSERLLDRALHLACQAAAHQAYYLHGRA